MLEHLKTAEEYEEGKQYILRTGRAAGGEGAHQEAVLPRAEVAEQHRAFLARLAPAAGLPLQPVLVAQAGAVGQVATEEGAAGEEGERHGHEEHDLAEQQRDRCRDRDGSAGTLILDNMEDRALHGTTDWTQASIVLDVAEQAKILLFGALVSGAGAIDLTRLRFEEADPDMPVTAAESWVLPEEPQALDFGAAP